MCGIAGILRRDGAAVDLGRLAAMTRTLTHRGPDEEGYYLNRAPSGAAEDVLAVLRRPAAPFRGAEGGMAVGLGHRRLSIIDLSSGQQPLSNEDGSVWVAFNGEIYNFQELQTELEARGHRFRTHCDTEAIVHAWEEWGEAAVERFRGMFAIALWDERRQTLWLARDRVGKKPLYYLADRDRVLFGSELKAILQAGGVDREIDLTALSDYLSLLYVPGETSIFRSIRKLPAGHVATVTRDDLRVRPYWDLPFRPHHDVDETRMADEMMAILEESVRLRMISDVPLGAFLSGGVDSSAVVAMMARSSAEPVITNSIDFSVASYSEAEHARRVAALFGTRHHEMEVTPEAVPVVERLAWNYDEPFADSSSIPTYYVSRTARENVTVSLSGDGGDENFAGYRRYWFDQRENQVRDLLPFGLGRSVFRLVGSLYPKADWLPQVFRGKAFLSNVARDPVDAYLFSVGAIHDDVKNEVLAPDVRASLAGHRTVDRFREIYDRAPADDHLSRIQYLDVKTYLCDDILAKVDRASMAVSLEVRCPILDHRFMEYVARIPSTLKLRGRDGKHLFKKALRRHLPDDILYRRKMGFGVPILEWLRGDLRDYARKAVLDGSATAAFLDRAAVERMWSEHGRGIRNRSTELWAFFMLNLWHERFARGDTPPGSR